MGSVAGVMKRFWHLELRGKPKLTDGSSAMQNKEHATMNTQQTSHLLWTASMKTRLLLPTFPLPLEYASSRCYVLLWSWYEPHTSQALQTKH